MSSWWVQYTSALSISNLYEGAAQMNCLSVGTTLNISQTTTVTISGKTESSTADNMKLDAKAAGQSLGFKTFTVVKVDLSFRTGSSNSASMDNAGRTGYQSHLGTTSLGVFFGNGSDDHVWRSGVEIVGMVTPSNFTGRITLTRNVDAYRIYVFSTLNASGSFAETSPDDLRDDDPQSGNSGGKVYDLDAPGIGSSSGDAVGTIYRFRANFSEWAVFAGTSTRICPSLTWFSRISTIKTSSGDQLQTDVTGDNVAGTGTTSLSWNLQ